MASLTYDVTIARVAGKRAMFVLPVATDNMPAELKEGITRRRLASLHGRCPCGGRTNINRAARRALARKGEITHAQFEHEDGCPATDDKLIAALGRWSQ